MDTIDRHVEPEVLARLLDERPDAAEAAHLASCDRCRSELAALAEDRRGLGGLADRTAPADGWAGIEAALGEGAAPGAHRSRDLRAPLRLAAGIALFLAGVGAGALATGGAGGGDTVAAATPEATDASAALAEAEAAYLEALARYAELIDPPLAGDPTARLAALESIVQATGVALRQAPADPVINGYHLSARGERDETLRQVARLASSEWYR